MERRILELFEFQVEFQCHAVLFAAAELERALERRAVLSAWVAIQNLLTAAANLAKTLWGQSKKFDAERKPLRDRLGVDDSWLLSRVVVRNRFEHFDEYLTDWSKLPNQPRFYVDLAITDTDTPSIIREDGTPAADEKDLFRQFNPRTGEVVFWGERFDLRQVVDEATQLLETARKGTGGLQNVNPNVPRRTSGGGQ
jgi:hypothetical protein